MRLLLYTFITMLCCSGFNVAAQPATYRMPAKLIYVKFTDDAGFDAAQKQLVTPENRQDATVKTLESLGWWSRVHHISKELLTEYRRRAEKKLGKKMPDFSAELHFHLYDPAAMEQAQQLLKKMAGVEKVLKVPVPVNAAAPAYDTLQQYVYDKAPGINADSARIMYSNKGAGIKICDIEYNYNPAHADLANVTYVGSPLYDPFNSTNHGTAVLGVIAAKDNGEGTTGIAPDCSLYFSAACSLPDSSYNLERAVTDALPYLSAGDIILFEQQLEGPNYDTARTDQFGLVAVEWFEPYYNVIQLAVGMGITVVEAAGNGQQNFDAPEYQTGNNGHYPFMPGNNSGAIIVGAGGAGAASGGIDVARARLWYSNYGSRIDVQGNGEAVYTTGYGDKYNTEGINKWYTARFGGTSSASPIVVGGIALMQSINKSRTGATLSTAQILHLLKTTGKAQQNGSFTASVYPIGPLPDIYKAVKLMTLDVASVKRPEQLQLYPNPTQGIFTVNIPKENKSTVVQVMDARCLMVKTYIADSRTQSLDIDLSNEPAGIYTIKSVSGNGVAVGRVVLAR